MYRQNVIRPGNATHLQDIQKKLTIGLVNVVWYHQVILISTSLYISFEYKRKKKRDA